MIFSKIFSIKNVGIFVIIFIFCLTDAAIAGQVSLSPSLEIKGEYNDNVLFWRTDEIDDFITTITPALTLVYNTELFNIDAGAIIDFLRYHDERDLDEENQEYNLDTSCRLTERFTLSGDFSYIKDTTLDSELNETGIVNDRDNRRRYNAGGKAVYKTTERLDIGCDYKYWKINYDDEDYVDYDRHTVTFPFNYHLQTQRDILTILPGYSFRDSDISEISEYKLSFGWSHIFSETFSFKIFAGGRYSDIRYNDNRDDSDNWRGTTDINFRNIGEKNRASIGYKHDLGTNADGTDIDIHKIYCRIDQMVLRRFGIGFDGKLYFTSEEGDEDDDEDSTYYTLTPSLFYRITEHHTLRLAYSYSRDDDNARRNDQVKERHRVWLSLNFNFPQRW